MKVNISSKGFTADDRQVALIEKKFGKLGKFFSEDTVASVTLESRKNRQTMEAMIPVKGMLFRAEYTDSDMNICVDKVVDKLSTQITRYKKKIQKNHHQNKEIMFEEVPETDEEFDLTPIKIKSFEITPMDADEAVLQMELIGHNFYVFMNSETDRVSVVYKRNDGEYGLIAPIY